MPEILPSWPADLKAPWVVTPTYNERDNVGPLIERLFGIGIPNLTVLVVDDGSPDGTGQLLDELTKRYPQLRVMHRPRKAGLGTAYVAGFRQALAAGADYICSMDADFSHDPAYLPALIRAASTADLALGSRYIRGGGIANWAWHRRLASRVANSYARLVLGVRTHDLTGGFKCYRRAVLERIDLDRCSSVGYSFLIETTYRAIKSGARVVEVPIIFTERKFGKSKLDVSIIRESCWRVIALRLGL